MSENMTNSQIINDIVSSINEGDFSDDWFVGSVNLTVNGKTESVSVNKSVSSIVLLENLIRGIEGIESFEIVQEEVVDPREQKYPTVYRGGGCGGKWIATMQFVDLDDAQRYIDQFDDERIVRWVKYRPQQVKFTRGGAYRESGVPSSSKLSSHILGF